MCVTKQWRRLTIPIKWSVNPVGASSEGPTENGEGGDSISDNRDLRGMVTVLLI